jgi:hypothetical protein
MKKKSKNYSNQARPISAAARQSLLRWTALCLFTALGSGCAVVKPWQRGDLANYIMQPDRDPIQDAQLEHVWFSREQASGGRGIGVGGCGCN